MEKHSINMEEHSINIFVKSDKYILGRIKYINLIDKLSKPDCQRSIDYVHVNDLYKYQIEHYEKFKEFFFPKCVVIGKLNNKYYLIDGQHRLNCIKRLSNKFTDIEISVNISLLFLDNETELDNKYIAINKNTPVPLPKNISDWKLFTKYIDSYLSNNYSKYFKKSNNPRVPNLNKNKLLEYIIENDISKKCKNNYKLFITELENLNTFYMETFDTSVVPYFKKNVRKYYLKSLEIQNEKPLLVSIYKNFEWIKKIIYKIETGINYENMLHINTSFRIKIKKKLRRNVWKKRFEDSLIGNCYVCVNKLDYDEMICGHIKSVFYNGKTNIDNLEPICQTCNIDMGIKNLNDYKTEFENESK